MVGQLQGVDVKQDVVGGGGGRQSMNKYVEEMGQRNPVAAAADLRRRQMSM